MNVHMIEVEGSIFWRSSTGIFFCAVSAFEFSNLSTEQILALKFTLELALGMALARPVGLDNAEFYLSPDETPVVLLSFGGEKISTWMNMN